MQRLVKNLAGARLVAIDAKEPGQEEEEEDGSFEDDHIDELAAFDIAWI